MNSLPERDADQELSDAKLAQRLWDLRKYALGQVDAVLRQAVEDGCDPLEARRRLEDLLSDDTNAYARAHYRLGEVSIGDALRQVLRITIDDPDVRAIAGAFRRKFVGRGPGGAAKASTVAIAEMLVESIRSDSELAAMAKSLSAPPPPRQKRQAPVVKAAPSTRTTPGVSASEKRRTFDAKIKRKDGIWYARCGNPMPGGCQGKLGRFEDTSAAGPEAYADFPPEMQPSSRWVLRSEHGYGGDAASGYVVLEERRTRGPGYRDSGAPRRPLPERFGNVGGRLDFAGYWHGFVGQLPQAPCKVHCPLCKQINWVSEPVAE